MRSTFRAAVVTGVLVLGPLLLTAWSVWVDVVYAMVVAALVIYTSSAPCPDCVEDAKD